jgi:hypothetical protein
MSNRNYHKIMEAVLEGIITAQKKGGFNAFVRMGNVVHLMTVIPVITFIKGDAKSGDTLVSRFGRQGHVQSQLPQDNGSCP